MNLTDLMDFASDPAFGLNEAMQVTGWNAGAQALLGYDKSETSGLSCAQVLQALYVTGEPLCSVLCEGRSCITGGQKWGMGICRIRHKNGDMIPVGLSSLVLPLEARTQSNGQTVAVIFMRNAELEQEKVDRRYPLRIFSLGKLNLVSSGAGLDVDSWKRKQSALVLKCLVSQLDRPVHRERLIEWIWPDATAESGWQRLKVAISYLRKALRKGGVAENVIETVGQSYLLRSSSVWVDSDAFSKLVASGWALLDDEDHAAALGKFEEAESLYRGEFFEDELYAGWCAFERARLRELHLEMFTGMVKCYMNGGKFLESARVCRMALSTDPCRENFIRSLMESMAAVGRGDWARAHFISWRRSLSEQYDIDPTEETQLAYERLLDQTSGRKLALGE